MSADSAIARSIVTTPDTPPERVAALRRAFDAAMKDPALLAEAEQAQQDISPPPAKRRRRSRTRSSNTNPAAVREGEGNHRGQVASAR